MHRTISNNFTTHTRYLFNGMEADNEVSGTGNSYTTEFRQYDPRLGHWKSLDPLIAQFPWQSPYCAFDNNPIFYTDPLGLAAEGGNDKKNPNKVTSETNTGKGTESSPHQIDEIKVTPKSKSEAVKSEHIKSTEKSIMSDFFRGTGYNGESIFYTDKGNPHYNDWMKTRRKVDYLSKISVGNLSIPLIIIASAEAVPMFVNPWVLNAIKVNTQYWGLKAGISTGSQVLINDGKVNVIGVITDATLGFGSSSIIQSGFNFEYDFNNKVWKNEYLGNGISKNKFLFSSTVGLFFGSKSEGLNNLLKTSNSNKVLNSFLSNTIYSLPSNGVNKSFDNYEKKD